MVLIRVKISPADLGPDWSSSRMTSRKEGTAMSTATTTTAPAPTPPGDAKQTARRTRPDPRAQAKTGGGLVGGTVLETTDAKGLQVWQVTEPAPAATTE